MSFKNVFLSLIKINWISIFCHYSYQESAKFERCGYEDDFIRFLQSLITDVEKRIRRGHQRLALNNQQGTLNGNGGNVNDEKITLLTERINELLVQAEELGCEGKVEESQGVMKLVDQLKDERHQLETVSPLLHCVILQNIIFALVRTVLYRHLPT